MKNGHIRDWRGKEAISFGTSFEKIAAEYQKQQKDEIVLALYNNRLRELNKRRKKTERLPLSRRRTTPERKPTGEVRRF